MARQSAELVGRGKILRFVADALNRSRVRATPPVVLLIGPPGSGKTVLLDRLEADHRTGSPTARLDFAPRPDASPAQVMLDIGAMLSPGVPRVGKVRLPRLGLGIIAVTLDPDSPVSVAEQLDGRLRDRKAVSGQALADLAAQAARLVPSPEQRAMVTEAAAVVGWIVDGMSSRRLGDHLTWYARNVGRGDGSRNGPLLELHRRWSVARTGSDEATRRDARRDVWRALCRALLADLRAEFSHATLRHGQLTTNCLLLLDNADSGAGAEFLQILAECRRKDAGEADPLLVVAAQRTRPRFRPPVGQPVGTADEELSYARWHGAARDPDEVPSPWYPVRLAELSVGNVASLVTSHVLGNAWRDVDWVHDLTGGHPAAVRELGRALRAAPAGVDPRDLLTPEMEHTLLGSLWPGRPGDAELAAMAAVAATWRPRPKAAASVFEFLRWRDVNVLDIWDRFLDLMWAEEAEDAQDAVWLKIRPLPRLLLSRWLARYVEPPAERPGDHSGHRPGEVWDRVHEGYAVHYRSRPAWEPVAEQHHQLALTTSLTSGNLASVAANLDRRLEHVSADQWNRDLEAITSAPNRLRQAAAGRAASGGDPALRGDPGDIVKWMAGVPEPGNQARIVTRLVAARWLYNDRIFDPRRRLARLIETEYGWLGQIVVGEGGVFYNEMSAFREDAREWEENR